MRRLVIFPLLMCAALRLSADGKSLVFCRDANGLMLIFR